MNRADIFWLHLPVNSEQNLNECAELVKEGRIGIIGLSNHSLEQIKAAENAWNDFHAFLEGCLVLWYDNFRQEKALLMLQDAVEPTTDNIKGIPYLLCSVKFVNIFGRSFGADDNTIETWLANGGKDADNG